MSPRFLLTAFLFVATLRADVTLPALLADHMVIQRGMPVHVWGSAAPGEKVVVAFKGQSGASIADELGRWSVYLPPAEAGGPFEMSIQGTNSITLRDVMVGDVWVASGQSNMEWTLEKAMNGKEEVAAASFPKMRLYHVKNKSAAFPQDDAVAEPWAGCTPATAAKFSAVAYFFGRDLLKQNDVPLGLISTSWGGTPAEAWTSLSALSSDASLMPVFKEWSNMTNDQLSVNLRRQKLMREYEAGRAKARAEGRAEPPYPWAPNLENSWMPAGLYNGMIAPLTRFPIKGAIWYQGESNSGPERVSWYDRLFQTMIRDWRSAWGQGDFPFLFVQLANYNPGGLWPELREAQRRTLELANTGMAVTIDIGNPTDIHPTNKQDVGHRLALAARAIGYGERVEYSGPAFRMARPEGNAVRVWFDHAGGLKAKDGSLKGFEIAGSNRKFVSAEARIDGETVVVTSPGITQPAYVRYAWAANPDANLCNAAGLPASPFRSAD